MIIPRRSRDNDNLCHNGFSLSASSPVERSKGHVIGFNELEHMKSVKFVDGKDRKGHLLEGCLMSFSNAIAWAIRQHPLVLRIDLCIHLCEMIKKEGNS